MATEVIQADKILSLEKRQTMNSNVTNASDTDKPQSTIPKK